MVRESGNPWGVGWVRVWGMCWEHTSDWWRAREWAASWATWVWASETPRAERGGRAALSDSDRVSVRICIHFMGFGNVCEFDDIFMLPPQKLGTLLSAQEYPYSPRET